MKFSIVTCTWNSVKTLGDTIDSVQSQDYPDIEHIFVDGGSTDGTLEMIAARCPSAKVLRDVGGGISRAMNAGIEAAQGDVIAHLHSDDYFASSTVVGELARKFLSSNAMWVYGQIDVIRDGIVSTDCRRIRAYSSFSFSSGALFVPHPATFVRSAAFKMVGTFDEKLRFAMDTDMWMRLGWRYTPEVLACTIAVFRDHPGSLSSSNRIEAMREEFSVHRRYALREPISFLLYSIRFFRRRLKLQRAAAQLNPNS